MKSMGKTAESELSLRNTLQPEDIRAVRGLVRSTGLFSEKETIMAGELVAETLGKPKSGYHFLIAENSGQMLGYTCFGRVPGTRYSWDLYWIAVGPQWQKKELGHRLHERTYRAILEAGGRQIWVETSGRSDYKSARAFYRREGYRKAAVLENYYAPAEDKIIYLKLVHS